MATAINKGFKTVIEKLKNIISPTITNGIIIYTKLS